MVQISWSLYLADQLYYQLGNSITLQYCCLAGYWLTVCYVWFVGSLDTRSGNRQTLKLCRLANALRLRWRWFLIPPPKLFVACCGWLFVMHCLNIVILCTLGRRGDRVITRQQIDDCSTAGQRDCKYDYLLSYRFAKYCWSPMWICKWDNSCWYGSFGPAAKFPFPLFLGTIHCGWALMAA